MLELVAHATQRLSHHFTHSGGCARSRNGEQQKIFISRDFTIKIFTDMINTVVILTSVLEKTVVVE